MLFIATLFNMQRALSGGGVSTSGRNFEHLASNRTPRVHGYRPKIIATRATGSQDAGEQGEEDAALIREFETASHSADPNKASRQAAHLNLLWSVSAVRTGEA